MILLYAFVLINLSFTTLAALEEHRVTSLPGWEFELPSNHYSGYLDVEGGRHLHYYFVEKHGGGKNAPVLVWTNGGPGCSSLDGFIYEHGPFRLNTSNPDQLIPFEFTWAKLANMLYLEAPAGVGFSYADNPEDYNTNDDVTALDNLHAMEKFYELFPEYLDNGLFLTGESYSGIYTPTLAEAIMFADKKNTYKGAQLKGIAVGNGCTGTELGSCSPQSEKYLSSFLSQTALISPETKKAIKEHCGDFSSSSVPCNNSLTKMHEEVGKVNLYDVYGECHNGSKLALKAPVQHKNAKKSNTGYTLENIDLTKNIDLSQNINLDPKETGPAACIDSRYASYFFNKEEVIQALHVKRPPYEWAVCANQVNYTKTRPNLPRDTYPELVEYLERTIIYNGDYDACVPWTDNIDWTSNMKFEVLKEWHPWTYVSSDAQGKQVAGYAVNYKTPKTGKDFIFTTIRGGRHEVPETAPEQAFELIRRLISGKKF